MTARREVAMRQLDQILNAPEQRALAGVDVLQEQKPAARGQHSRHLGHCPLLVRNSAEDVRADDGVEPALAKWQLLGTGLSQLP